ncbi:MAG: hypothetical protein WBK08_07895 [Nitrospira sp.]|nr:MAG: hypothetical protein E8D42_06995 [Nitrospira sp.]
MDTMRRVNAAGIVAVGMLVVSVLAACSGKQDLIHGSPRKENTYLRVLDRTLTELKTTPPQGITSEQARVFSAELRQLPFASVVSVLAATSFKPGEIVSDDPLDRVATRAANEPDVVAARSDKAAVKDLLVNVFRRRISPKDALQDETLRKVLLTAGIKHLAKEIAGVSATQEEIQEVIGILETGTFFGDASSVLHAVFNGVESFPRDVLDDIEDDTLTRLPIGLLHATIRDATGFPGEMAKALGSLASGKEGTETGQGLNNTLGELKKLAVTKRSFVLLRSVLSKNNRSARLALIFYARANHIKISEDTIDTVYVALDPDNPSLGLPLKKAIEVMTEQLGYEGAIQFLRLLTTRTAERAENHPAQ